MPHATNKEIQEIEDEIETAHRNYVTEIQRIHQLATLQYAMTNITREIPYQDGDQPLEESMRYLRMDLACQSVDDLLCTYLEESREAAERYVRDIQLLRARLKPLKDLVPDGKDRLHRQVPIGDTLGLPSDL